MDDMDELDMELNAPNDNEWDEESFNRRMDTVSNASSKLGALLLQGWTMLAEECPNCQTPMMKLQDGDPQCVVCNPVQKSSPPQPRHNNNNNNVVTFSQPKRVHKNRRTTTSTLNNIDENNELKQLNELNDALWSKDDDRFKKKEDASDKIGQLLLSGWTMLAQHCNKCQTPLMSLRGGPSKCCICDSVQSQTIARSRNNNQNKRKIVDMMQKHEPIQPQKSLKDQAADIIAEAKKQQNVDDNSAVPPRPAMGMNGFGKEQRNDDNGAHWYPPQSPQMGQHPVPSAQGYHGYGYYHNGPPHHQYQHHPPPPFFGFGPRQDQQLRRTVGDIVKTVLDKMSVINERMNRNDGNLQNDIQELNALMEFLQNIKKFKNQMRY